MIMQISCPVNRLNRVYGLCVQAFLNVNKRACRFWKYTRYSNMNIGNLRAVYLCAIGNRVCLIIITIITIMRPVKRVV